MNEQDYLNQNLLILKSTVEVYVHGTLESSHPKVRNLLKKCLEETMTMQANTYDEMVQKGYYKVENTSIKNIQKAIQKTNA